MYLTSIWIKFWTKDDYTYIVGIKLLFGKNNNEDRIKHLMKGLGGNDLQTLE